MVSLTAFDENGQLDEGGMRAHLRRLADAGVGVYVGGSGSGEGRTLSLAETQAILEIAADELKGKAPVRGMGVDPFTAGEMVQVAKLVESVGLDAMQIYTPVLSNATEAELEAYFDEVLSVVRIPAILSIHHATYRVSVELLVRVLRRFGNVIGINCTNADDRLIQSVDPRIQIHVADRNQILNHLALGGHGFVTSEGNLAPRLCQSIVDFARAGNWASLRPAAATLIRLHRFNATIGGVRAIKGALQILGLPGGFPRKPRLPAAEAELAAIARMLDELDVRRLEGLPEQQLARSASGLPSEVQRG